MKTTDQNGPIGHVDGTNLCVTINGDTGTVAILKEEEVLSDNSVFHGGDGASSLRWVNELDDPCCIGLEDPFLTPEQQIMFMQPYLLKVASI
ncbi:hypothetical protein ACWHAM_24950 [Paenibacillus terrae]